MNSILILLFTTLTSCALFNQIFNKPKIGDSYSQLEKKMGKQPDLVYKREDGLKIVSYNGSHFVISNDGIFVKKYNPKSLKNSYEALVQSAFIQGWSTQKRILLQPNFKEVSISDLKNRDSVKKIKFMLELKGNEVLVEELLEGKALFNYVNSNNIDQIVYYNFSVGKPESYTTSQTVPIFNYEADTTVSTTGYGNTSYNTNSGQNFMNSQSSYTGTSTIKGRGLYVSGYQTVQKTKTLITKSIQLDAFSTKLVDGKPHQTWTFSAFLSDGSYSLSESLPILLAVAYYYYGQKKADNKFVKINGRSSIVSALNSVDMMRQDFSREIEIAHEILKKETAGKRDLATQN